VYHFESVKFFCAHPVNEEGRECFLIAAVSMTTAIHLTVEAYFVACIREIKTCNQNVYLETWRECTPLGRVDEKHEVNLE
jgi:hypothetical protein